MQSKFQWGSSTETTGWKKSTDVGQEGEDLEKERGRCWVFL